VFRIGRNEAIELGNALLEAVEFIDEEHHLPIAVERHEKTAVVVPEYVSGENTMLVVDP
jgi:uncharacterized protein YdaT